MSVNVTWLQYATYASVDYAPGDESSMADDDYGRYSRAHYVVLTTPAPPVPPTPTVVVRWLTYLTWNGVARAPGDTDTIPTADYVRLRATYACVLNSEPNPPLPYPDPFPQYVREFELIDPTTAVGSALRATFAGINPTLASPVYVGGNLTSWTENGVACSATYNADGTVHTLTTGTITRTFTYNSDGTIASVA